MSEMTNVGDHVNCPQCGREARVVWISQNEKTVAIKCMGYHSHGEKTPPQRSLHATKLNLRRNMSKEWYFS